MISLYGDAEAAAQVFLGKGVLKICSKFTGGRPCRSTISTKVLCNFIEITLRGGWSPANLVHIFRRRFSKSASGRLQSYAVSGGAFGAG